MTKRTVKKRRRQNKTDYKLRLALLKSPLPRIVIRKTNRYFIVQVVESIQAQDKVICGVTSKDLLHYGWDKKYSGSLKSIPAGYLTGLLLSKKLKKGEFIIDAGMQRTISGSRIFSVVRGLIDGGLHINANQKIFPPQERIQGTHIRSELSKMAEEVRKKI